MIEESSGNVYADLHLADADEMLIKSKLVYQISLIIKRRNLTQQQAAQILAMPQPKLSNMLRGQFRGISESKLLEYMTKLGQPVEIVVTLQDRVEPEVSPTLIFA